MSFNKLVISGGSTKGFVVLGSLQYIFDKQLLKTDTYVGTSMGAMVGYLLSIGYSPTEIMVYICTKQIFNKISNMDINSMIEGNGATNFTPYTELEKMTIDKIGYLMTLGDLKKKFNKTLICCTYNFTKQKIEYLNPDDNSDMPCLTAIRMSSNLPFVFERFKYMDCFYIDGGVADNFPVQIVDDGKNNVLGINTFAEPKGEKPTDKFQFLDHIYNVIFVPIYYNVQQKIKNVTDNCTVLNLPIKNIKTFDFNLSNQQILDLFSQGYQLTKEFFEEKK